MATKKTTAPADPFQANRDRERQSGQLGFRIRADQRAAWTAAAVAAGHTDLSHWIKAVCDREAAAGAADAMLAAEKE